MTKQLTPISLLTALFFAGLSTVASAQETTAPAVSTELTLPSTGDIVTTQLPVLRIDASGTTVPWTHLNFNNSPRNFQFAIVTDRTGGVRPGIFEDAVKKLNLLQPEFVMSVGDLIMGYTQNLDELTHQWTEFIGFVKQLKMPFFYVPGNHDLANAVEHRFWDELIGKKYYSFTYGDVLFLCVNSEDPTAQIGAEQVAYFDKVLKENRNVRWTLVFLHRPLWVAKEGTVHPDQETYSMSGWEKLEQVLQGRPYTVFAGHFHSYTKEVRRDQRYITLATTGGGTQLRGALNYGEFDHVAWVTMTDNGPIIANLELSGIWDEDVRTSAVARMVNQVTRQGIMSRPVVTSPVPFTSATAQLRLTNNADIPLKLWINFEPHPGVSLSQRAITKTLDPNSVEFVDVALSGTRIRDPLALQDNPLRFKWRSLYEPPEGQRRIELNGEREIEILPPLYCINRVRPIEVDGSLGDWNALPIAFRKPRQTDGRDPWNGPQDASASFSVQADDKFVYIAADVTDNFLVTSSTVTEGAGDGIEIRLRAASESITATWKDPLSRREIRKLSRARKPKPQGVLSLHAAPGRPSKIRREFLLAALPGQMATPRNSQSRYPHWIRLESTVNTSR